MSAASHRNILPAGACSLLEQPACVLRPDGRIVELSPAFASWLQAEEDVRGMRLHDLAAPTPDPTQEPGHERLTVAHRVSGQVMRVRAFPGQDGTLLLIAPRDEAGQAPQAFLANISHELRTPLGAILGLTDLVLEGTAEPRQRRLLRVIRDNAEILLSLISDSLDMSQLGSGKLVVEHVPFSPTDLIEECAELLALRAQNAGLSVDVVLETSLPRLVGDPVRIRQVLINLLGNAVKFTEQGGVLALARAEDLDAARTRLMVTVSDSGIGVDPSNAEQIFAPFAQAEHSLSRRREGAGLGLAISRELARAMGGDLVLLPSEPGEGASFRLELILQRSEQATHPDSARMPLHQHTAIVACTAPASTAVSTLLSRQRVRPITVAALAHAEDRIHSMRPPGIVVVDDRTWDEAPIDIRGALLAHAEDRRTVLVQLKSLEDYLEHEGKRRAGCVPVARPVRTSDIRTVVAAVDNLLADTEPLDITLPARASAPLSMRIPGIHDVDSFEAPQPDSSLRRRLALSSAPPVRVLLVDDNPDVHLFVQAALREMPIQLSSCRDPRDAADRTSDLQEGIVLLDIQMPLVDGFTVARQLREKTADWFPPLVILGFTAQHRPGLADEARQAGMNGVLQKPITAARLREVLQPIVDQFRLIADADTLPEDSVFEFDQSAFTGEFKTARFEAAAVSGRHAPPVVEVPADLHSLTETYRLDRLHECDLLDNHLAHADLNEVSEIAHRIKGTAASFGFQSLTRMGRDLETAARNAQPDACTRTVERMREYLETVILRTLPDHNPR